MRPRCGTKRTHLPFSCINNSDLGVADLGSGMEGGVELLPCTIFQHLLPQAATCPVKEPCRHYTGICMFSSSSSSSRAGYRSQEVNASTWLWSPPLMVLMPLLWLLFMLYKNCRWSPDIAVSQLGWSSEKVMRRNNQPWRGIWGTWEKWFRSCAPRSHSRNKRDSRKDWTHYFCFFSFFLPVFYSIFHTK